ncbi:ubinuclein-2 [Orussus abietinus]|uniref:ubinuclein-2 n=1 Tax=Orussus abietinus TaxID=222816 RepID=UPI0006265D59|nr:ubinuclein-2 [Orussus abietinus]
MSDAKRPPLQSLDFSDPLGHVTKKGEKGKQLAPSFRFELTLPESNEKTCPEFNYAQLLKAAEKKRRKEQKRGEENTTNGLDPFDDDEDEEKLREVARRFEAKYGTAAGGRSRHCKANDGIDLGAGYDENDSFIDNTDAYDEIVPKEVTTAHGGFYINCGALEYKITEGHSLVHNNNNNNNNNNDDESSESSGEEDDADSTKRMEKRSLSYSDDDDTEDISGEAPRKKPKLEDNPEKKTNHEATMKKKKKSHHHNHELPQQDFDGLNRRKNTVMRDPLKEKRETDGDAEEQDEKRSIEKPDLQRVKSIPEKKFDGKKFEKKASSNGLDWKKVDSKKFGEMDSNIDDAIESVVNAARVEDESSRDTLDSGKSRGIPGSESECDDLDKEESPLPECLPEDIKEIVNALKVQAETSKEGKSKFFTSAINNALFGLEKKLRSLNMPSVKSQTYDHLAHFLPCSKITLVNRAKKLFQQDVDGKVKDPIQRLKAIVDSVMPSVMDKYTKECQRVTEEKGLEGSPTDVDSSDGDESGNRTSDKSKIPRRRFPWTEETKKLVYEIAHARRQYFEVLKPRKESMETFVAAFMEKKVLPLWPLGWVQLQTLIKYSNAEPIAKKKSKRPKEIPASNSSNANATGNAGYTSNVRLDPPNSSNSAAPTQEREKTPTSLFKTMSSSENPLNFVITSQAATSNDHGSERKHSSKHKDRSRESPMTSSGQYENANVGSSSQPLAKISVVPTSQLMAQKSKALPDKFNPMDLTSSSLSITPVNDYQKSTKTSEAKKDVVSITAYSESSTNHSSGVNDVTISQTGHHSSRQQESFPSGQLQHSSSYSVPNRTSVCKPVPLKHRILQETMDPKTERRTEEKEYDSHKTEKRDKRRDRYPDGKHKSHDSKKRKKDLKLDSVQVQMIPVKQDVPVAAQPPLSKEEQEQRQIEETMAATNFLSQIINDDHNPSRPVSEKRKEPSLMEDAGGAVIQTTEQENDVQMVMRSLKELQELQELQEMKYSPSHSPVGVGQKPNKSNVHYVGYQEDYQRLYHKKDDKLRLPKKEDAQW